MPAQHSGNTPVFAQPVHNKKPSVITANAKPILRYCLVSILWALLPVSPHIARANTLDVKTLPVTSLPGIGISADISNIQLKRNNAGQAVIVWEQRNGELIDLYVSYHNGASWSNAAKLADGSYGDRINNKRAIKPRAEVGIDAAGNVIDLPLLV